MRDYVPVYNTFTETCGLYDKVAGRLYANMGTEDFVAGPEVN